MTMKLQLAATMEEEKNTSNEIKQKILKESFDEYTNKAKECSSRLKTDIIEKRGKEKLSEINKDNADLKLKLQAATDSKDNMNLKLCQMESNHTILQNRNAAILIRLRKSLHDAECERRAIKEKLYSLKLSK
ncbi:uncharacterized protein LOC113366828 [Ctenocephalides felis]|uniref:uncharacterized protein LOC113366828 n=1 Tax=Ctenocephalides felis TaxID=7515 RepID=UPI000E6E42F8|nr:uncharacterized protein LOC113366828 [Ctenocephalides felis]